MNRPSRRLAGDRGASLVEFALLLPLLMMVLLGMITGGIAYGQRLNVSHATREAARYGSTLPDDQFGSGVGSSWASAVLAVARDRSGNDLNISGATICVALVTGNPAAVYTPSGGTPYFYSASYPFSSSSGAAAPCFSDGNTDGARRVQVSVTRPGKLEAVLFTQTLTLRSQADGRFEFSLG